MRDARVEPPSHISDAVPWQLDNIVMRLLAREPDARYASGSALVEAIDDYLDSHDEIFDQEALSDFMVEAFSVMLQVTSFKLTGKRIFRMSPLHHHFELVGWKEPQIVIRFWIVAVIFALVSLATLKLR